MIFVNVGFGIWLGFIAFIFWGLYLDMKERDLMNTWEGDRHKEAETVNSFFLILIFILSVLLMISVNA